jgi:hypothetical protein
MATPLHNIRVDADLWQRFAEATAAAGSNRTEVLVNFIRWYVRDLPERPTLVSRSADGDHERGSVTLRG